MPRIWDDTIAGHRQAVRDTVLDTAWRLVTEHGALSVTMSQIAAEAGIGRATLYKYFTDVEDILQAWHERQVADHLSDLRDLADQPGSALERLRAVLTGYAEILKHQGQHSGDLTVLLHRGTHVSKTRHELTALVTGLITEAAKDGQVRRDLPPRELAAYCLHALNAGRELPKRAAVRRMVDLTFAALGVEASGG